MGSVGLRECMKRPGLRVIVMKKCIVWEYKQIWRGKFIHLIEGNVCSIGIKVGSKCDKTVRCLRYIVLEYTINKSVGK